MLHISWLDLSQSFGKLSIVICCTDKLATDTDAAFALFLFHHSSYDILADTMYLHFVYEDDMATNHQKILHVTQWFKWTASCTFHPSIIIWVKFSAEDLNMMFFRVYEFCTKSVQCKPPFTYHQKLNFPRNFYTLHPIWMKSGRPPGSCSIL
jgi:hypothetical protein